MPALKDVRNDRPTVSVSFIGPSKPRLTQPFDDDACIDIWIPSKFRCNLTCSDWPVAFNLICASMPQISPCKIETSLAPTTSIILPSGLTIPRITTVLTASGSRNAFVFLR